LPCIRLIAPLFAGASHKRRANRHKQTVLAASADGGASVEMKANFTLSPSGFVTGTSTGSVTNTYLVSCSVTGVGGLGLRILSDSTRSPVAGETISAVDTLGCNNEEQVVYITSFLEGKGGWLTPVFPPQATPGGSLNFTVNFQGQPYKFSVDAPPVGTSCVTLQVPSGNLTKTIVINGSGSNCG
jgi:hypothetical protein